jgi:hypothetical protein
MSRKPVIVALLLITTPAYAFPKFEEDVKICVELTARDYKEAGATISVENIDTWREQCVFAYFVSHPNEARQSIEELNKTLDAISTTVEKEINQPKPIAKPHSFDANELARLIGANHK